MKLESFTLTKMPRNEQLVRELDRKRHHELFYVALTGLVLTAAVIAYAWPHFEMIRLGYRMEELRQRREDLLEAKHHLELQRATEADPARIEAIAKNELGMVYPSPEREITVEPLGTAAVPSGDRGRRSPQ